MASQTINQSRTRFIFSSGVDIEWLHQQVKTCITEKKAIIVVGAGVSIAVTGSNDASWKGLLKMGIDRCAYVGDPRPDPRWKAVMLKLLEIGDIEDWLLIAEDIQLRLQGGEMRTWLADWSINLQLKNDGILRGIHAFGLPIMTTNYDSLIEQVSGRKGITLDKEYEHELIDAEQNPDKYVLHLHGHHGRPKDVVLGIRSYDRFLGDESKSFFMKRVPWDRSVIFVGCGAGLEDPNFRALKNWIKNNRQDVSIRHYRLLAEEEDEARKIGVEARIIPVIYGKKYIHLQDFMARMNS